MHSIRGLQLTTFSLLVPFQMTESQLKDLKKCVEISRKVGQ